MFDLAHELAVCCTVTWKMWCIVCLSEKSVAEVTHQTVMCKERRLDPFFFKTGDKTNPGSYRPVKLTSVVCKVFEGFIWDAINQHFAQNKLLVDQQYGFMSGGSCITQLLTNINENLGGIKASGCCLSGSTKGI